MSFAVSVEYDDTATKQSVINVEHCESDPKGLFFDMRNLYPFSGDVLEANFNSHSLCSYETYMTHDANRFYHNFENAQQTETLFTLMRQIQHFAAVPYAMNSAKTIANRFIKNRYNFKSNSDGSAMTNEQFLDVLSDGLMCHYTYNSCKVGTSCDSGVHIDTLTRDNEFKPCFFVKDFETQTEYGKPFYVAILLENNNSGPDDYFKYKIKWVGSYEPLTEIIRNVPLCFNEEDDRYNQKLAEYKSAEKEYYDDEVRSVFEWFSNSDNRQTVLEIFEDHTYTRWTTRGEILSRSTPGRAYVDSTPECETFYCNGKKSKKMFMSVFKPGVLSKILTDFPNLTHMDFDCLKTPSVYQAFNNFAKYIGHPSISIKPFKSFKQFAPAVVSAKKHYEDFIKQINDWLPYTSVQDVNFMVKTIGHGVLGSDLLLAEYKKQLKNTSNGDCFQLEPPVIKVLDNMSLERGE